MFILLWDVCRSGRQNARDKLSVVLVNSFTAFTTALKNVKTLLARNRVGVLKDVLGFEDTIWSPWPWPRILQVLESAWCPRLEDSTIFWLVENEPRSWPILFCLEERQRASEKNFQDIFFWRTLELSRKFTNIWSEGLFLEITSSLCPWSLALSIPVLSLERVFLCPWPRALCPGLYLWQLRFHYSAVFFLLSLPRNNCSISRILQCFHELLMFSKKSNCSFEHVQIEFKLHFKISV